jgi:predicted pyridoxine 5'-phosphate oxidase superfamily flavin-nucleotide-binding protein
MSTAVFHEGERAVQARAGVRDMAERVGRSIRRDMPPAAQAFLAERRWIVLAALDAGGRPRIAIRAGAAGFAQAIDSRAVRIDAAAATGDPLDGLLGPGALVGFIALDVTTRRRLRFNGRVRSHDAAGLILDADQVFSNCPKYIQRRDETPAGAPAVAETRPAATSLTDAQRDRLRATDTFFIATGRPGDGVDVSHRGGMPGFVAVDGARVSWPDYSGNAMFTTLGNIHAHPHAALLVPDFARGGALIVAGRAAIEWAPDGEPADSDHERRVHLDVDHAVEQGGVLPLAFQLREYSPFNPR